MIIARDAIDSDRTACNTPVQDTPFPSSVHAHGDGLHLSLAAVFPVSNVKIKMSAPQAMGTVITIFCSWSSE